MIANQERVFADVIAYQCDGERCRRRVRVLSWVNSPRIPAGWTRELACRRDGKDVHRHYCGACTRVLDEEYAALDERDDAAAREPMPDTTAPAGAGSEGT